MREITITALNTGVLNSVSATQEIQDISDLVVNVAQASGAIGSAVVTVEQSIDGSTWSTTGTTITGAALSANIRILTKYMRLKVTTASASPSTATCTIQGKPGDLAFLTAATVRNRSGQKAVEESLIEITKTIKSIESFVSRLEKQQGRK